MDQLTGRRKAELFQLRCPSCAKLYEVNGADIQSSTPQFQCVSCTKKFSFSYLPGFLDDIICYEIDAEDQVSLKASIKPSVQASPEVLSSPRPRSCPKCGTANPLQAAECSFCQVIFARLEGLGQEEQQLRAQPSLIRRWRLVADDFENEAKHDDFIKSCQQLGALSFALKKYQDLRLAQGGDAICDRMIQRIHALTHVVSSVPAKTPWTWRSYSIAALYMLSVMMILWGAFSLSHRNLIGLGVATACLATGLVLSFRGPVQN